jgi:hypothetical protein
MGCNMERCELGISWNPASDVIFLLKKCRVCAHNLSKRAKNPSNDESPGGKVEQEAFKKQDIWERAEEEIAYWLRNWTE